MDGKWKYALAAAVLAALVFAWRSCRNDRWALVHEENLAQAADVLCFGDSLVAGVGADTPDTAYPRQLSRLLGRPVQARGFPGSTAAEALAILRQDATLKAPVVIVTLGGNDILQQRPAAETDAALREVFRELQQRGALVAYTGVTHPLGAGQTGRQRQLCRETGVLFIPDVLKGILAHPDLMSDQVHPNGAGYERMAARIAGALKRRGMP